MFLVLLLALIVIPIVELYLFVQAASAIGFFAALFWIVAISIIGAALVKRAGIGTWRKAQAKAQAGEVPAQEMIGGLMLLIAGGLMLVPGFLTAAVGLVLLLPPTRAVVARLLLPRMGVGPVNVVNVGNAGFRTYRRYRPRQGDGVDDPDDIMDVESWEEPPGSPGRRELP